MDTSLTFELTSDLIHSCEVYGQRVVDGYEDKLHEASRAFSMRGAEKNSVLNAQARMAECTFCLWAGLNPRTALDWSSKPDHGSDVRFGRYLIDVKHSGRGVYLIWPAKKAPILPSKKFDALAFVRGLPPRFELVGVVSKARFVREHSVADDSHQLFSVGTLYLHESALVSPDVLREHQAAEHFCYVCGRDAGMSGPSDRWYCLDHWHEAAP